MGFGGFFKGEKKKQKQNKKGNITLTSSNAPVFTLPKLVEKKRKNE